MRCTPAVYQGQARPAGVQRAAAQQERLFSLTALRSWHAQQDTEVSKYPGTYAVLSQA